MTVTQDLSFVSLISNASILVQLVLLLLLTVSVFSWTYIFRKMFALRAARAQTEAFERAFWSGGNLAALYQDTLSNRRKSVDGAGAMERIFQAGMGEFNKSKASMANRPNPDHGASLDGARRAMRAAYQREMDSLESHLAFLASVGSVSPYVGLFGTVWGIMNAFRGLANVQQATLASVAPGIAEALVATAIGLFAAIPAVVAYNRYSHDIDRLAIRFETFIEEFSNILQRQAR
ncbi:MAG TPA: protein TolQ [Herbaspirillum sp.]|jgi:biopolymer transport protein TolQ